MEVNGRLPHPARTSRFVPLHRPDGRGGIMLRIEDHANGQFWIEIHVTAEEVSEILNRKPKDETPE